MRVVGDAHASVALARPADGSSDASTSRSRCGARRCFGAEVYGHDCSMGSEGICIGRVLLCSNRFMVPSKTAVLTISRPHLPIDRFPTQKQPSTEVASRLTQVAHRPGVLQSTVLRTSSHQTRERNATQERKFCGKRQGSANHFVFLCQAWKREQRNSRQSSGTELVCCFSVSLNFRRRWGCSGSVRATIKATQDNSDCIWVVTSAAGLKIAASRAVAVCRTTAAEPRRRHGRPAVFLATQCRRRPKASRVPQEAARIQRSYSTERPSACC